ncbi:carboxypeptidase-like regulatory domain-containing protein [Bacteroidales bacterium OttesenSCG-928-I21]|nr:carboxypeptidase-like regulatory domain-containing protein [Bacteroidales bacterium OttesenSCG-928-I21]
MNAIFKIFIVSLFFILQGYIANCQFVKIADRVIVAGYIFEENESNPLPFVNVYIKKTRIGTITDTSGYFVISANIKDTLSISCLGYHNRYIVLNDTARDNFEPLIIFLDTKVYELSSVNVVALRRYKQFEYDFKNLKLPDDDYTYAAKNFPFKPRYIDYYSCNDLSVVGFVFHPITALYEAFSKEGRELRKLEEIKKKDAQKQLLTEKIDIDFVMKITDLNKEEANAFLYWCNFSSDFVSKLSEYELVQVLKQSYSKYVRGQKPKKTNFEFQ